MESQRDPQPGDPDEGPDEDAAQPPPAPRVEVPPAPAHPHALRPPRPMGNPLERPRIHVG
jgi:hypothetical protein